MRDRRNTAVIPQENRSVPESAITGQPAETAFAQVRPCFPETSNSSQRRLGKFELYYDI